MLSCLPFTSIELCLYRQSSSSTHPSQSSNSQATLTFPQNRDALGRHLNTPCQLDITSFSLVILVCAHQTLVLGNTPSQLPCSLCDQRGKSQKDIEEVTKGY
jgi:hypothetical protein